MPCTKWLAALFPILGAASTHAEYMFNFPAPATPLAEDILRLHNQFMLIIFAMFVAALGIMIYSLVRHRKSRASKGEHCLQEVDNPVVLPVNKKVRILLLSTDVIHSWWVPQLGVKRDAVPGYRAERQDWRAVLVQAAQVEKPDLSRQVTVDFAGNTMPGLSWEFSPRQPFWKGWQQGVSAPLSALRYHSCRQPVCR